MRWLVQQLLIIKIVFNNFYYFSVFSFFSVFSILKLQNIFK